MNSLGLFSAGSSLSDKETVLSEVSAGADDESGLQQVFSEFDAIAPSLTPDLAGVSRAFLAEMIDHACPGGGEFGWKEDHDPVRAISLARLYMAMSVQQRAQVMQIVVGIVKSDIHNS